MHSKRYLESKARPSFMCTAMNISLSVALQIFLSLFIMYMYMYMYKYSVAETYSTWQCKAATPEDSYFFHTEKMSCLRWDSNL